MGKTNLLSSLCIDRFFSVSSEHAVFATFTCSPVLDMRDVWPDVQRLFIGREAFGVRVFEHHKDGRLHVHALISGWYRFDVNIDRPLLNNLGVGQFRYEKALEKHGAYISKYLRKGERYIKGLRYFASFGHWDRPRSKQIYIDSREGDIRKFIWRYRWYFDNKMRCDSPMSYQHVICANLWDTALCEHLFSGAPFVVQYAAETLGLWSVPLTEFLEIADERYRMVDDPDLYSWSFFDGEETEV